MSVVGSGIIDTRVHKLGKMGSKWGGIIVDAPVLSGIAARCLRVFVIAEVVWI